MKRNSLLQRAVLFVSLIVIFGVVSAQSSDPVLGTIRDDQPFFEIPIVVADEGSTVEILMEAINGSLDPMLYLVDSSGNIVDENDDRTPNELDAFIRYVDTPAGEYTAIATRFGVINGDTIGDFRLRYRILPPTAQTDPATETYAISDESLLRAGYPPIEPRPKAKWTILAYYGGDTDLEASIMNDFDEFERAGGSTDDVRVIVLMDRSPRFSTANGDWQTARLFEVSADITGDYQSAEIATIDSEPLADLGQIDTGDGETLAQFLVWALRQYPADHYALSFASHGAGWQGVIADESGLYSLIPVTDLQRALNTATQSAGVPYFDLLINDACSMGSAEYNTAMSRYFGLSYASPEIVANPALDMSVLLTALKSDPDIDLSDLGRLLVDRYMDTDIRGRRGTDTAFLTHAVIDLKELPSLDSALSAFVTLFEQDPTRYSTAIGQARANAYVYSAFIGDNSTVDLGNFMGQVIASSTDVQLVQAAQSVLNAESATVLYGRAGSRAAAFVTHTSIYFPETSSDFQPGYLEDSPLRAWGRFLRSYYNAITPRLWIVEDSLVAYHPPVAPQVTVTRVYPSISSSAFPPTISVEIVGRRIASGALTIDAAQPNGDRFRVVETPILTEVLTDEGATLVNSWKSGVDQAVFNWLPPELPVVSDGVTSSVEFLRRVGETASLDGRFRPSSEDDWTDVSVIFDLDGDVQTVISRGQGSASALAEIQINPGAEFQVYRAFVTPDGELRPDPGTVYTWPVSWHSAPAPNGDYDLGFLVRAFGGVSGFDSVRIEIENDTDDNTLLGYADINLGINFQRPAGWTEVIDQGNWLTTSSPNNDATINLYYFRALDNVFAIRNEVQARFGINQQGYGELYFGHEDYALKFSYSYQLEDGSTWTGHAVSFHRETAQGGRGIVLAVDARDGSEAAAGLDALFDETLANLTFFDAERLAALDSAQWRYDFFDQSVYYPMRTQWAAAQAGDWLVYHPTTSAENTIAITTLSGNDPAVALDDLLASNGITRENAALRVYNGEYHDYQTAQYTQTRDGKNYVGRFYITKINDQLYALHFETLDNSFAVRIFRSTFEPVLDGFAPPVTVNYAVGSRNAYVKAALLTANKLCANQPWNSVCYIGRQGESLKAIYLDENGDPYVTEITGIASLENMVGFQVGALPDDGFDPFSVAVLSLQANLPDGDTDQSVQVIVFGGATVFNNALVPLDTVESLMMVNLPDVAELTDTLNMRSYPAPNAYINGAIPIGTVVKAVGRTENGNWLRVEVPRYPERTGWVQRQYFVATGYRADFIEQQYYDAWRELPVSDPSLPYFTNMQSLEVLFPEDAQGDALNGLLIQTTPTDRIAQLQINGAIFDIQGSSLFFWRGSFNDLESVSVSEQSDVFDDTIARRRPSGWESEVLAGSVQIRLSETGSNIEAPTTITGSAGQAVQFGGVTAEGFGTGSVDGNNALGSLIGDAFGDLLPDNAPGD